MVNMGNFQMPMNNMSQVQQMPQMQQFQQPQQVQPVICPPQYRYSDQFIPRQVPVIHPVVNVNRQHMVDVPRHYYTETTENVMGAPMVANRGCGNMGGCGGFRQMGRSRWM